MPRNTRLLVLTLLLTYLVIGLIVFAAIQLRESDLEKTAAEAIESEAAQRELDAAQRAFDAGDYKTALHKAKLLVEQGSDDARDLRYEARAAFREAQADATGPIDLRQLDGREEPIQTLAQRDRFVEGLYLYDAAQYGAAFHIWLELADAGHAAAQLQISRLYFYGKGVERNLEASAIYLKKSSNQGYVPALEQMADESLVFIQSPREVTSLMRSEMRDENFLWEMMAAIYGESAGYAALATFHCYGAGVRKDPVLADIWTYMTFPAKEDFLAYMCHDEVEFLASYYEAIKERAEAMSKAYDIPIGGTPISDLPPAPPNR